MRKYSEKIMKIVFLTAACVSILAVILICVFLFASGVPAIREIGVSDFLLGGSWKPNQGLYGVFPMIVGSIYVTAGAVVVGVPIGLLCAVFMARYCPAGLYRILKPAVDLLAGIPSIVYGFFGLMVIVPMVQNMFGGSGKSLLTASVLLGIMILPTIISVAESNIRAVPEQYYEGSLALGATRGKKRVPRSPSGCEDGYHGRYHPRYRKSYRRNDGCRYGLRQPGDNAARNHGRSQDSHSEHSTRDGICVGPAQRSPDRYSSSAVRVHPDHKSFVHGTEKEG